MARTTAPVTTAYAVPTWDAKHHAGSMNMYLDPEYAGTVAHVVRQNVHYLGVTVAATANWRTTPFRAHAAIWRDVTGQWVVDYRDLGDGGYVEVDRTRDLLAAINVAVWSASERGHVAGWW